MGSFAERVEAQLEGIEAVSPGGRLKDCPQCEESVSECEGQCGGDHGQTCYCHDGDSSFSWSQCDGCGSTLGGDRHDGHGILDGQIIHLDLCVDCVMYLANGEEPQDA